MIGLHVDENVGVLGPGRFHKQKREFDVFQLVEVLIFFEKVFEGLQLVNLTLLLRLSRQPFFSFIEKVFCFWGLEIGIRNKRMRCWKFDMC